jgi:predicted branched-subunit amino acid permease
MKSIPIMCSYIFVSMAYGMMMENAGFAWYYSLLTSLTVYTGAFQFVLITFLSSGASIVTIAVTALLMKFVITCVNRKRST